MNKKLTLAIIVIITITLLLSLTSCYGNEISISFDTKDGNTLSDISVSLTATSLTLPTPVKEGYNFEYWCYDSGATERVDTSIIPTEDTTFYAKWSAKLVTLTFISTDPTNNEVTRQYHYVSYGSPLMVTDMPKIKEVVGYQSAWLSSNIASVTEATTIYAKYSKSTYFIKYYVDGEEYKSYKGIDQATVEVPQVPTKEDHYFVGWYEDAEGTIRSKTTITKIPGASINLYAKFIDISESNSFFRHTTVGGNVKIEGLTLSGKQQSELVIPQTIGGNNVTSIGYNIDNASALSLSVFSSENLQRIIIPNTVDSIGSFAFYGSTALKEVIFEGNSLVSLGTGAFANCPSLTEFDLPDSVTSIGRYCFAGIAITDSDQNNIEFVGENTWSTLNKWTKTETVFSAINITQNSNLTTINDYAFFNLQNFSSITLPKHLSSVNYRAFANSNLSTINAFVNGYFITENNTVYSADGKTLMYYPLKGGADVVLKEGTTAIASYAFFDNKNIVTITSSSALVSIGQYAFYNCSNLTNVDLSNTTNFTSIGTFALANSKISSFEAPSTLSSLGQSAFYGCTNLTTFSFGGDSLGIISQDSFNSCTALTSIIIPSSVTTIGKNAFYNCNSLALLEFKDGSVLKTIEQYAFTNCTSISTIALPSSLETISSYAFAGVDKRMNLDLSTIPSGLKTLGDYAFQNTKVSNFSVNSILQSLGKGVFKNCTSLSRFTIVLSSYITSIPEEMFFGCTMLNQIAFPYSIMQIGDRAFFNCSRLTEITFNKSPLDTGLTSIGESAFEGCSLLFGGEANKRVLPTTLTSIGVRAFYGCRALTKVYIPSNLEHLSARVFANCTSLTEINYDAGSSLKTIGESAFANCTSLQTARLPHTLLARDVGNTQGAVKNPFVGCTSLTAFTLTEDSNPIPSYYVIEGVVYRNVISSEQIIGRQVYLYPAGKNSAFEVNNNITSIDRYSFYGSAVSSLSFNYNVPVGGIETITLVSIGAYAFSNSGLNTTTISKRVYFVGENSFSNTTLTELNIENTVVNDAMPSYNITNSDITNNTLTIGKDAFKSTNIAYLQMPERLVNIQDGAFSENYLLSETVFANSTSFPLTIGNYAFFGNSKLTKIVFPQQLSTLGDYAFANCFNMQSVNFNYLHSLFVDLVIGKYAFSNNHYLYTAILPQNLSEIKEGAFSNNTRLSEIRFASSINALSLDIPSLAFFGCNNLNNIVLPSYISEIGEKAFYKTKLEKVILSGDNALIIGDYAFAEISTLKEIDLPSNEITVGKYAFFNTALSTLTYADSGNNIILLDHAFDGTKLTHLTLNSRFVDLGSYAFANTNYLAEVSIFGGITSLGAHTFENSSIEIVTLDNLVTDIGEYAFASTSNLEAISGAFTSIGDYAFNNSNITSFTLSQVVASLNIGNGSFSCTNLASINLENMVTGDITIGDFAFAQNSKLSSLKISGALVSIGEGIAYNSTKLSILELTDTITDNYFCDTSGALYKNVGENVELVQYPAGNSEANYTLPQSTASIGNYAFYGNNYLMSLIISADTVLDKHDNTFTATNSKLRIYVAENLVESYQQQWNATNISYITTQLNGFVLKYLGNDEYSIIDYANSLAVITINGSMTITEGDKEISFRIIQIEDYAFANNANLLRVTIGNGINTIYNYAFANCANLTQVIIGQNVRSIKNFAFAECINLESVIFGSNLDSIGNSAFRNCAKLNYINLPNSLLTIGDYAFSSATSLTSINLGNSLQNLGNNAFEYNTSLVSLTLPSSLRTINQNVFFQCEKLTFLYVLSPQAPTLKLNAFRNTSKSLLFFVNESSKNLYRGDAQWRAYSSKILSMNDIRKEIDYKNYVIENISGSSYRLLAYLGSEDNVTIVSNISDTIKIKEIGSYAISHFTKNITISEGITALNDYSFANASNLESVTLPASLVSIGTYSFSSLVKLQSVTIANYDTSKLSVLAPYAFYNTSSIVSITLPKSLASIGDYAFAKTSENLLASVTFNSTLANSITIGMYAFSGNTKLKNISFDCVVSTLGEGAFANCNNLEAIYFNSQSGNVTTINGTKVFENCNKLSVFVRTQTVLNGFSESWKNSYDKSKLILRTLIAVDTEEIIGQDGFVISPNAGSSNTASIINYLGNDTEVTFPSQVTVTTGTYNITKIGREDNSYVIGSLVTKVIIPASVSEISDSAFRNSASLVTVELPADSALSRIGKSAFRGSKKLKTINIPKSITVIDEYAFASCSALDSITFANLPAYDATNLDIRQFAFSDCTALKTIVLPLHTRTLGASVFSGATALQDIVIDVQCKLASIAEYAFNKTAITSIYLPITVVSVANYSFANCTSLRAVYLNREISGTSSLTIAGANIFDATCSAFIKIYVPLTSYSSYTSATGWETRTVIPNQRSGDFSYIINAVGNNTVTLTNYLGKSTTLNIPSSIIVNNIDHRVTSINRYFGNENIKEVVFDSNNYVTSLGRSAFASCVKLEKIHLPNNITTIEQSAFYGCSALKDIKLPDQLNNIQDLTFAYCTSLAEISVPASVIGLGNSAFMGCTSLSRLIINFTEVTALGTFALQNTPSTLKIVVGNQYLNNFAITWSAHASKFVGKTFLLGDFILEQNDSGYSIIQYNGKADIDLTTLTFFGKTITEITENSIIDKNIKITIYDTVTYHEGISSQIVIKED